MIKDFNVVDISNCPSNLIRDPVRAKPFKNKNELILCNLKSAVLTLEPFVLDTAGVKSHAFTSQAAFKLSITKRNESGHFETSTFSGNAHFDNVTLRYSVPDLTIGEYKIVNSLTHPISALITSLVSRSLMKEAKAIDVKYQVNTKKPLPASMDVYGTLRAQQQNNELHYGKKLYKVK